MEEEEEEIERTVNNITTDISFQSPVDMNAQKKDSNMSYEIRIASGILVEKIKEIKGCTIQSTINDSGYCNSYEQIDPTNDSEEQVDGMNWLINNSYKQVDQINYSNKQVDAISYSEKLVDAGSDPKSDPKSDPSSDPKVST